MTTRLHWSYPTLAQSILDLQRDKVQFVIQTAARLALANAELDNDLADTVLAVIDGRAMLCDVVRAGLEQLQQEYDNQYLDMQDQELRHEEQPISEEGLRFFYRARALAAVLAALDVPDDPAAAADIVYETIASSANEPEIVAALWNVIR